MISDDVSYAASAILETLYGFLVPIGYLAFRCLLIPTTSELSDNPELSILDETETQPGISQTRQILQWMLLSLLVLWLLMFVGAESANLHTVMVVRPLWGAFVSLLGISLVAMIALVVWLHRQNEQYTDLLTGSDEHAANRSAARYAAVVKMLRIGGIAWLVAFAMAIIWLWGIAHNG